MDTKALRQKILDLAIHGKLVPYLTSDKPHYPFELPKGWVWCKLDDLAFYKKGPFGSSLTKAMFVPKSSQSYKVYEQKNAIHKDCALGSYYITKEKYDSLIGFAVQPYDIIVSCAGTIGETYVLPAGMQEGIINQALMLIRLFSKEIERFYLLYFDFILKDEAYRNSKGTAIKNIPPFDVLKNFFIPIPPIGEQKRILDEVDRLMSFVSTIETGTKNLHTAIKQAKFKILELAIHGKLVSQDQNDEPASELLKRINPKAEIITDNGHYQKLPVGWTICRLKDISKIVTGSTPSKSNRGYYGGIFPFFKPADLDAGRHVYKATECLSEDGKKVSRVVPKGATAICCIGTIGKVGYLMYEGATNQQINCAIPSKVVDSVFLFYLCASPLFNDKLNSESSAVTISIVNKSKIEAISVPLPPLAEQKRIVSKIEEIFAQLEAIETAL